MILKKVPVIKNGRKSRYIGIALQKHFHDFKVPTCILETLKLVMQQKIDTIDNDTHNRGVNGRYRVFP